MLTRAAAAADLLAVGTGFEVFSRADLLALGCTRSGLRARLAAGRWRKHGKAVVTPNGELTREQRWRVSVINCGPRAVLSSFSAAEALGLTGWAREETHVLAPAVGPHPASQACPSCCTAPPGSRRTS